MACTLTARVVFPVSGPPIADGFVKIEGGLIVEAGEHRQGTAAEDLGNVALLPGLVNAHTHLEFSGLDTPLGQPGMPLPDWIRLAISDRAANAGTSNQAIVRGLDECLARGTTTLGEIAQPGWSPEVLRQTPLGVTAFLELIGLAADRVGPLCEMSEQHLLAAGSCDRGKQSTRADLLAGLSPHAPYSVHPDAIEGAIQAAQRYASSQPGRGAVAMHLAESREELELLSAGTGSLAELLKHLGVWQPGVFGRGAGPLDYLEQLSRAPRALVVHGNYLARRELEFLAEHRRRMSLVYCPRTHAYFGHKPYPLAAATSLGINVALGTDSRASNPDLNLLEEMRHVARHHPGVRPQDVVSMGTLDGARALGLEGQVGTLEPGKLANLTAIALPESGADPYELLLAGSGQAVQTWTNGDALRDR